MVNENETKIATTAFAADLMHFRHCMTWMIYDIKIGVEKT